MLLVPKNPNQQVVWSNDQNCRSFTNVEKCCKNLKHFSQEQGFSILSKAVEKATYQVKNTMESCWRETNISLQHNCFVILLGKWRIDALQFLAKISTFLDQKMGPFHKT